MTTPVNIKQAILDAGLNVFGAELLAESFLRLKDPREITFPIPINRSDCPGWAGVEITLKPIPKENSDDSQGEKDSN